MFKIKDITACEGLDSAKMAKIKGGLNPFSHLGMYNLMSTIPGYQAPQTEAITPPDTYYIQPGEAIYIEDSHHTEITTHYPA